MHGFRTASVAEVHKAAQAAAATFYLRFRDHRGTAEGATYVRNKVAMFICATSIEFHNEAERFRSQHAERQQQREMDSD
ncbi:MAG: hypothetical protein MHM6MM_001237 [Cercozoa sp. M6MM]